MALNATISKAELHIADMDRHYYQQHNLTLAQHPSETAERLMLRLLVFALHASERLAFTRGLSTDDEPDIWQKDLVGDVELWIELGLPSDKRIRKACGQAKQVVVYSYGRGAAEMWWKNSQSVLARFDNLTVVHIPQDVTKALAQFAGRQMQIQINIQDGDVSWHCGGDTVSFAPEMLMTHK